jgi:peroxiredoxin
MSNIEINKQAPDFTMLDVNGKEFRLSQFKGEKNVYLVLNRGFG